MKRFFNHLYQNKIIAYMIIVNIAIQLFYISDSIYTVQSAQKSVYNDCVLKQTKLYTDNAVSLFDEIKEFSYFLEKNEIDGFVGENIKLLPDGVAAARCSDVFNVLNNFNGFRRYIDSFYIFGSNNNQCSLYMNGSEISSSFELLSADDLKKLGILDYIYTNYDNISVFDSKNIKLADCSPELAKKGRKLLDFADGRITCFRISDKSITLLFLNDSYFKSSFSAAESFGAKVSLFNEKGEMIYNNGALLNSVYVKKSYDLTNSTCRIIIEFPSPYKNGRLIICVLLLLCFFVVHMLFVVYITGKYCYRIMRPYKILNNIFKMRSKENDITRFDLFDKSVPKIKNKFVYHNIFRATVAGIILPCIISGVMYFGVLAHEIRFYSRINLSVENSSVAAAVNRKIHRIMTSVQPVQRQTMSMLKNVYFDSGFSRNDCVVTDGDFRIVHNEISRLNVHYLDSFRKQLMSKADSAKGNVFILGNFSMMPDMLIAVNRIYGENGRLSGVLCTLVKNDVLLSTPTNNVTQAIISSGGDEIIASDIATDKSVGLKQNLLDFKKEYYISKTDLPYFDWSIYILQKKDFVDYPLFRIMFYNIAVSLLFMLITTVYSWRFAASFNGPLHLIRRDMQADMNGIDEKKFDTDYDEVKDVISAYNEMVDQINLLIEEKSEIRAKQQELMTLKIKTEMNSLQHQINPHFLYNTLEVINLETLKYEDRKASKMINALSRIFNYSMVHTKSDVSLSEEINNVKYYILIQQYRYEGKVECRWNIDEKTLSERILKLVLQPLVENAYKYGLSGKLSGGILEISSQYEGDYFVITVADNGIGMRSEKLFEIREKMYAEEEDGDTSIGIRNVYRRLKLYTDDDDALTVDSEFMKGTVVKIRLKKRYND